MANCGVSGDTTQDGAGARALVLAEKPAVVVLEFGGQRRVARQPLANHRGQPGADDRGAASGRARVVLAGMTLPPNYGPDYIRRFEADV